MTQSEYDKLYNTYIDLATSQLQYMFSDEEHYNAQS